MCGGGGGTSEKLAKEASNQEQARQDRIAQGMQMLKAVFEGGNYATGQLKDPSAVQPGGTYFDAQGNPISVAMPTPRPVQMSPWVQTGGGGDSGPAIYAEPQPLGEDPRNETDRQKYLEGLLGKGLYSGVGSSAGFGPEFFDKAYKAQLDYALPQVDKQYQDAQKQLTYALARQGLSASSQAGNLQGQLQGQRDLAIQGEQGKASDVRTRQQQAVEDERATLTQLLQQTGDAESTANMARSRSDFLRNAPALEAVGPLFQNVTGTLADLIVSPALRAQGGNGANYGYGSSNRGSGKIIGG
jgi:hypothetical protein